MSAIKTAALSKHYGSKKAVESLDLEIAEGELFALLGVNGAGKTTTIKMLSGLIRPTSGCAQAMGMDVVSHTLQVKELINVSPQETAVAPNLTVRENLELICALYGLSKAEGKQRADVMIEEFSLKEITQAQSSFISQ